MEKSHHRCFYFCPLNFWLLAFGASNSETTTVRLDQHDVSQFTWIGFELIKHGNSLTWLLRPGMVSVECWAKCDIIFWPGEIFDCPFTTVQPHWNVRLLRKLNAYCCSLSIDRENNTSVGHSRIDIVACCRHTSPT